jgi:hypothetical protein
MAESDYSLKRMRKPRRGEYKPKTLMERHPLVVQPPPTIPVNTDSVIRSETDLLQRSKNKKRAKKVRIQEPEKDKDKEVVPPERKATGCGGCRGVCGCGEWDKEVTRRRNQRFY